MRRIAGGGLAVLALAVAPGLASAQGVDETCVLALTKFDPATVNVAYVTASVPLSTRYRSGSYDDYDIGWSTSSEGSCVPKIPIR